MQLILYVFFLWLYRTGIRIISPWNRKARLWFNGRKEMQGKLAGLQLPADKRVVWMHCASLGEFEQGRPILQKLREQYDDLVTVLTFFSPSGYEVRKNDNSADHVFYLPADSKRNAPAFIDAIRPSLVFWIKYEYWYFYLHELRRRGIPVLLISAIFSPEQPFFKWHGRLHRSMLECFEKIFVQNSNSMELLGKIGLAGKVILGGDTRFDRVVEIAGAFQPLPLVEAFCAGKPVIVAGSTWEEDEEEIDHYANTHPDIRFIIAPHEIDQGHLNDIDRMFRSSVRYSALEKGAASSPQQPGRPGSQPPNVLVIDNIGMLSRLYRYATIAYVGGGFGEDGVHNVLEAAVYGKPVIYGPVIEKFAEAIELAEQGGGIVVDNAVEAEQTFERLFSNAEEYAMACKASRDYVYSRQGATGRVIRFIHENRLLTS